MCRGQPHRMFVDTARLDAYIVAPLPITISPCTLNLLLSNILLTAVYTETTISRPTELKCAHDMLP
jgi:hypothetical protein